MTTKLAPFEASHSPLSNDTTTIHCHPATATHRRIQAERRHAPLVKKIIYQIFTPNFNRSQLPQYISNDHKITTIRSVSVCAIQRYHNHCATATYRRIETKRRNPPLVHPRRARHRLANRHKQLRGALGQGVEGFQKDTAGFGDP
jgi:hypothetical protein